MLGLDLANMDANQLAAHIVTALVAVLSALLPFLKWKYEIDKGMDKMRGEMKQCHCERAAQDKMLNVEFDSDPESLVSPMRVMQMGLKVLNQKLALKHIGMVIEQHNLGKTKVIITELRPDNPMENRGPDAKGA